MTNVNRTTNRRQMLFASGVLISGLLPTDRTVAQEDGIQPVFDPLVGKTWVALASDSKTHAAVIRVESDASESAEVRCYLSDGETRSDWFTGPFKDGLQSLISGDTTLMLHYVSEEDRMSAAVTGGGSGPMIFNAYEATGLEGLYEVGPVTEYALAGSGTQGQLIQLHLTGDLADGSRLLSGLIALPDDSVHALALFSSVDAGGELHIVIVPEGSAAGGPRIVQGVARGSGSVSTSMQMPAPASGTRWVDPEPQPWIDPAP